MAAVDKSKQYKPSTVTSANDVIIPDDLQARLLAQTGVDGRPPLRVCW